MSSIVAIPPQQFVHVLDLEPFPLYPGETLDRAPTFGHQFNFKPAIVPLPVIKSNHAIKLQALVDHTEGDTLRQAGAIWQIEGPLTYKPTPEVEMLSIVRPEIIHCNQALLVSATQDLVDFSGTERVTAEEWLIKRPGAYLPGVYEKVLALREAYTLTQNAALHMKASHTLVDASGKKRSAGSEWLVTLEDTESYIPEVGEVLVEEISRTVLSKGKYCVALNPVDKNGNNAFGKQELRRGVSSFFLRPGEVLKGGIRSAHILANDEALLLGAKAEFVDAFADGEPKRKPGDRWMITGPVEYIPPIEVKIITRRKAIPLNKNEGIYVRNTQTGEVRSVMGPQAYLLTAVEVPFEKELPDSVEVMLKQGGGHGSGEIRKMAYYEQSIDPTILKGRDKTRVVTYRCPHNSAVQVYNYKKRTARVIYGPDLIILQAHENFNVLSLSAGKPKKTNALQSLCLMLGPDFITDILEVETADHARLRIKIAFNNHFEYTRGDPVSEEQVFAVPDFIGFACKQVASRIRAQVAQIPFDDFHRHSAAIIQGSVFGYDDRKRVKKCLKFEANNLVVSSIDVQSIEPVDPRMRDSLMKSVQMAIEISTKSVEASAAHEAQRMEQVARGHLEQQKLVNEKEAEKERAKLFSIQAVTAAIESTGQAKAEAQAQAEKTLIECQSEIEAAKLKALAAEVEQRASLEAQEMLRTSELSYIKAQNELEVRRLKALAHIETQQFSKMVSSLGKETISRIAKAGPESKVKLLASLGLSSVLFTDGKSPVNLFNTSEGLIGSGNILKNSEDL